MGKDADPFEWMHGSLARLLPVNVKANEEMMRNVKADLQSAGVRSTTHLANMSMEDLKMAKVLLIARKHLFNGKNESYVGQENKKAIGVPLNSKQGRSTEPTTPTDEHMPAQEPLQVPFPAAHCPSASLQEEEGTKMREKGEAKKDDEAEFLRIEGKRQKQRIVEIDTAAKEAQTALAAQNTQTRSVWSLFQRSFPNHMLSSAPAMDAKLTVSFKGCEER